MGDNRSLSLWAFACPQMLCYNRLLATWPLARGRFFLMRGKNV